MFYKLIEMVLMKAVNDLQELINEINEVNISKSKQEGDEGMAYTAIQEGEKIIENVKTDLQGLIQATADFIVKIMVILKIQTRDVLNR